MNFSNSILYSVVLHCVVLLFLALFTNISSAPIVPATEITFVRLNSTALQNSGTPQKSEDKSAPEIVQKPTVKEMLEKTKPVEKTESKNEPKKAEVKKTEAKVANKDNKTTTKADNSKSLNQKVKPTNSNNAKNTGNEVVKPKLKQDNSALKGALAGIEQEVKQREKTEATNGETANGNGGAGNIVADDPAIAQYRATVKSRVVRNLVWPGGTGETVLIAKVTFRLSPSGGLISASFAKSSGNGAYDAACMRAVQNAAPFPPPPAGAVSQAFVVEFRKRI